MPKETKNTESESLKRLRSMVRIAGPNDPIYSSGLTMNSVRSQPEQERPQEPSPPPGKDDEKVVKAKIVFMPTWKPGGPDR